MLGKLRYAVDEIAANYDRQTWWQNRATNRVVGPIQSRFHKNDGIRVLDREGTPSSCWTPAVQTCLRR